MAERTLRITEHATIPALSIVLGFGPMIPLAVAAAGAWLLAGWREWAVALAVLWGGVILCFLAGVRRGVSFRTEGGPTLTQILTMLWLFLLGLAALAMCFLWHAPVTGLLLLAVGYASVAMLDPWAASRGEAPLFFARLRPVQMVIPVASLLALIARLVTTQ